MSKPNLMGAIGTEALFVEHYGLVTDLESGGDTQFPATVLLHSDLPEERVKALWEKAARGEAGGIVGSNGVECSYYGTTGRTVQAMWTGKRWATDGNDLTPATVDIESLFKLG